MDRLSRVANRMGSDLREGIERLPGLGGIALFVQFADSDDPEKVAFTNGRTVWAGPRYPEYEEAERLFIILHELLHVGLAHPARAREIRLRHADFDPRIYNVACFPAGTLLPSNTPIERVATMHREVDENLVVVRTQAGEIAATAEHPFKVKRKRRSKPIRLAQSDWVSAEDIRVGDYLCVPRLMEKRDDAEITLSKFLHEGVDKLGRRRHGQRVAVKRIPLDADTAWLIGLYTAEGSSAPNVRFTLGAAEIELAARVKQVARKIGYSASESAAGNTLIINLGAIVLGRWLKENCGARAPEKHIPDVILRHRDPAIRKAFLEGLAQGDAHLTNYKGVRPDYYQLRVSSEALARDVVLLLAQDGKGCSTIFASQHARQIRGKDLPQTPVYGVYWRVNPVNTTERTLNGKIITSYNHRWKADEEGVWYPVTSISSRRFAGTVYNLTTESHTYIAGSYLVHNCDSIINASLLGVRGLRCPKDAVSLEELLKLLELWPENKSVGEVVRQWSSEALYYALMRARDQVLASKTVSAYTCDLEGDGRIPAAGGDEEASADETLRAWRSRLVMARGALAGVLSRLAKELPEVKTPWERVLRDYLYRLARRKRSPDPSRPSRRWLALERVMRETEGVELPFERGVSASKSARLVVGFDTSASIGDDILARFVAELSAIITKLDPTVRLVVCDAAVHQVFDLAGAEAVRFLRGLKLKGGGGTDFRPAIAAAAAWKPDVMIYLTDLEGEAGEPPRFPVLWATPAGGAATPWGRRIELI